MVSDYFTKPLQGSAFRKLRQLIMNTDETESGPSETRRSVLKREQAASHGSSHGQAEPRTLQEVTLISDQETARQVGRRGVGS
jgi:hypothetical protein